MKMNKKVTESKRSLCSARPGKGVRVEFDSDEEDLPKKYVECDRCYRKVELCNSIQRSVVRSEGGREILFRCRRCYAMYKFFIN